MIRLKYFFLTLGFMMIYQHFGHQHTQVVSDKISIIPTWTGPGFEDKVRRVQCSPQGVEMCQVSAEVTF